MKKKKCAFFLCDKQSDAGEFCYAHERAWAAFRRKHPVSDYYPRSAPTGKIVDVDGVLVIEKLLKSTDGRLLKNRLKNKPPRYGRRVPKA